MYRVIKDPDQTAARRPAYLVQKKRAFLGMLPGVNKWETLNIYGVPLDYFHDWEDAEPARFHSKYDAVSFAEDIAFPKKNPPAEVVARIHNQ